MLSFSGNNLRCRERYKAERNVYAGPEEKDEPGLWSRSPSIFGWLELEPKILKGGAGA